MALLQHEQVPETNGHEAAPEHGAAGGHFSAHEGEHAGPDPINWANFGDKSLPVPYAALLINLAVLVFIIVKMGKKPVQEALVARRDKVVKDIEEASRMKQEAEARAETYQAHINGLASDLEATKKSMVEAGVADKQRLMQEAESAAIRMRKDAEFSVEQQRKTLAQSLHRETATALVNTAVDMLKSKVTPADHERLAEQFLADLERGHVARGAA